MAKLYERAAAPLPASYVEKDRTIEITVSSEHPVARGSFDEVLSHDPGAVDLSRFIGAPFLNSHMQGDARHVLGVVTAARLERGELIATVKLSRRADAEPIIGDVLDGISLNASAGYSVQKWAASVDSKSGRQVRTATRWRPLEVSLTPIGADPNARVRAEHRSPDMKKKLVGAPALEDDNAEHDPANENAMATRNAAIRTLCRSNGMTRDFEEALIDNDGDLIEARAAVIAEMEKRTPAVRATTRVGFSNDDPAVIRQRRIDARYARETGTEVPEASRAYVHETLLDLAKSDCQRHGVSTFGLSPDEIFQRAATHGTSDFIETTTGVGRRVAEAAYKAAASPIKTVAKSTTVTDLRPKKNIRMSGAGLLEEVNEHGEITGTTRFESVEGYRAKTYARMFGISRAAYLGDDLGMLTDQARAFGQAGAQTEAAELVALLELNPLMSDNVALFDASRNNIDAGNSPISIDSISEARLAMRQLKDADGTLISVAPKYLLVSAELETAAQVFVAQYQPINFEDANPFSNLIVLVEPRLAPFTWYLFADPASAPVLEYAHLAGAQGVIVESRAAWTTLGLETRAYLDFGCGAIGSKGAFKFASGEDSNSQV